MALRKARTFLRLPRFVQLWLVPAWCLLGTSRALLLLVPFRNLAPRLGESIGTIPPAPIVNAEQATRARLIGESVRLAARYTPWNSNCLPQAVVARVLLGLYRVPYALYFGVRTSPGPARIAAHAWVASGAVRVTGGTSFGRFKVVGVFVGPGPSRT